ncbi:MAG: universal stress protein [Micromonosporaceae bacterium]|jgi:nucleotide-binding universal stress UspA family protein
MDRNYLVVVGVDGSDSSLRALQWAAHEAAQRGGTVQAITAWRWDVPGGGIANEGPADMEARDRAAQILEQAVAALTGDTPVATEVVEGRPADVLAEASRDADLLVLGSHGHSRVWTTVLGSVAEETIRQAHCPVVVIPADEEARRRAAPPAVR